LSLVDPDNRRPVDFAARQAALAAAPDWRELASQWPDGRLKLALTGRLLALRNALPAVFGDGDYARVEVTGPHRDHIVAFRRSAGRDRVVVAVARHFAGVTGNGLRWPDGGWQAELKLDARQRAGLRDALGCGGPGESPDLAQLFAVLPVAVLRGS
jgi:(1->4)-alpha-D-glucan 1-alpha-D-glucosylmutase